jgi:hypothetical protein
MVTPQEAEQLAKKHIEAYMNDCKMQNLSEDAGKALMKLVSVAGIVMVATVGYEEAVERMHGTAMFVEQKMLPLKNASQTIN